MRTKMHHPFAHTLLVAEGENGRVGFFSFFQGGGRRSRKYPENPSKASLTRELSASLWENKIEPKNAVAGRSARRRQAGRQARAYLTKDR